MFSRTWCPAMALGMALALAAPVAGLAKDRDDCNTAVTWNGGYSSSYGYNTYDRGYQSDRNNRFHNDAYKRDPGSQTSFTRHNQVEPLRSSNLGRQVDTRDNNFQYR